MDGRWILAAPNAPSCGIEFSGGPGAGKLNPEGGCPAHFFTGRTWTLDGATLTIKDDQDAPLAQLQFVDGRFNGQSSAGVPVMLTPTPMP